MVMAKNRKSLPNKFQELFNMRKKVQVTQLCQRLCDPRDFSRPEYWSGKLFPSPGDLPNPGIEPNSPVLQVDSSLSEPPGKP